MVIIIVKEDGKEDGLLKELTPPFCFPNNALPFVEFISKALL
jgi:hypothetical protein